MNEGRETCNLFKPVRQPDEFEGTVFMQHIVHTQKVQLESVKKHRGGETMELIYNVVKDM